MLPVLELASDGDVHSIKEAVKKLSDRFELSEEERKALLPSGTQTIVYNRVGWARTYLHKAGLLDIPKRGCFSITDDGRTLLQKNLDKITAKTLEQYPDFVAFKSSTKQKPSGHGAGAPADEAALTPEEAIEKHHEKINEKLSDDLVTTIQACSPSFFEKLVIDLLVKMGYGGSLREAGEVIGKSGDEGIDGIIKEDRLGLDTIYVQAKRWKGQVGRPEIQKFAGALLGKKAKKGILITTSDFSKEAIGYASGIENKIVLIDGGKLAQLMIEHGVGVSVESVYQIKRLDSDYFEEED